MCDVHRETGCVRGARHLGLLEHAMPVSSKTSMLASMMLLGGAWHLHRVLSLWQTEGLCYN
jgi:hypothetical protein